MDVLLNVGLPIIVATPFILALLIPSVLSRLRKDLQTWVYTAVTGILSLWLLSYFPTIAAGETIAQQIPWVPQLNLNLSFYLDGFSLLFALVVTGIGTAIVHFAGYYFEDVEEQNRFFPQLFLFMGAMLGVVLAGNLLLMFIAWELTSITSFLLIGFKGAKSEAARKGATRALVITGGGGLALLVGVVLLGTAAGSMEFSDILNSTLHDHPWYAVITILMMVGAFTKSAQFPFHFWLPGAMEAPTPVSGYLHSATMVKAGVYLLFRLYPVLGDAPLWTNGLVAIGLFTMLLTGILALWQRDLKALLAYSTINQLGILVALIGLPAQGGLKAALLGILAHALYKATLFMVAGTVDHTVGTRVIDKLGGLFREMRGLTVIAIIVALSMAGIIPLFGFVSKETLIDAMLNQPGQPLVMAMIIISAAFTGTVGYIFIWDVFFAKPKEEHHLHHLPNAILIGPGVLAGMTAVAGLLLDPVVIPLIDPALTKEFELYLFGGFNDIFILSTIAVVGGFVMFLLRGYWLNRKLLTLPDGAAIYERTIGLVEWAADQLLRTQNGKLRHYLIVILGTVALLMAQANLSFSIDNTQTIPLLTSSADMLKLTLIFIAIIMALGSIVFQRRINAALSLGVMGYAVGGIFLLEPGPDVALVQFLVETLGTVLIVIMLSRISPRQRREVTNIGIGKTRWGVWRDIVIAGVIGVGVAMFSLAAVIDRPERDTIAVWYLENAYEEIGINDVVASILTDFRGTDTLVEIAVFAVAGLGVLTLLSSPSRDRLTGGRVRMFGGRRRRRTEAERKAGTSTMEAAQVTEASDVVDARAVTSTEKIETESANAPGRLFLQLDEGLRDIREDEVPKFSTPLTRFVARLVLPFAFMISLSHILYGGDAPGDGFTAGVVSGLAVALWYVVFGYFDARRMLSWLPPGRLIAVGFGLALVNAIAPMLVGRAFFAITKIAGFEAPADLHLASTLVFELAIFLTVFGAVSVVMEAIAHPREVEAL